jgi:hypothetical protein
VEPAWTLLDQASCLIAAWPPGLNVLAIIGNDHTVIRSRLSHKNSEQEIKQKEDAEKRYPSGQRHWV